MSKHSTLFIKNPCVWYLGAWCLYYLQGTLYSVGSPLSRILVFSLIAVSLYHAVLLFSTPGKPLFFNGLNAIVIMYTFYGLLLLLTDGLATHGTQMTVNSLDYLKSYYMTLLPIYSCYYYTRNGYLTKKIYSYFAVAFVVVGVFSFYRMQREMIEYFALNGENREEVINNSGYVLLSIIPALIVLYKRPILQYVCIGICLVFVLLSMKRGAILCAMVFLLAFIWHKMKNTKGSRKLAVIMIIGISLYLLVGLVEKELSTSDFFVARIEQTLEGNTSGREAMFASYFSYYINDAGIIHELVGHGANGTVKILGEYAHNDWLELLINQGLLGIIIFIFYLYGFWKATRRRSIHIESRFALTTIFLIFFIQTFFSGGITNSIIFSSSMMGFALADGFREDSINIQQ